ncbi:hypothetical protein ES677_00215 [Bizionia gelidisalsuginis]|uniref:Glycerophosphoryl diester phosphodiesterase membrane domain-containing protein n=2 Tax=Bizionia TaxID=283785 RepID=A0A8H2LGS2_9FLAO|nr:MULTISPECIES: hypothetical protein [Bizionia]TYB77484.1 hypothetical protein ES676_04095 [Bizionia saleffrena]TYC17835.1 hypothetical protein ES677_00215 [Bizionia gelidisalsuginis]
MKPYIEFKAQRDLGQIITDTFNFIRNEFKPFFGLILQVVLPYLLVMFAALAFYFYTVGDLSNLITNDTLFSGETPTLIAMFSTVLILIITGVIAYVLAHSTALYYIKSYVENGGVVNTSQVKDDVKNSFWNFVGLGVLVGIVLGFGFALCVIPGVYMLVPLSLSFSLMVFKSQSVTDAFSNSFSFIKNEWWISFLTIVVVAIIVGVIGSIFSVPAAIYSLLKMGIFSGESDPAAQITMFQDPVYIILNVLSYALKYFLNFISIIAGVFIYFNINEKKNFSGTFDRIDSLGKTE